LAYDSAIKTVNDFNRSLKFLPQMPGPRIVAVAALLAWIDQASSSVCEAMEEHASCAGSTDVGGTTQLQSTPDLWATYAESNFRYLILPRSISDHRPTKRLPYPFNTLQEPVGLWRGRVRRTPGLESEEWGGRGSQRVCFGYL